MQINTLQAGQKQLISCHDVANIIRDTSSGQYALYAVEAFETNSVICRFSAQATLPAATYLTIQTGEHTHITLDPAFLKYTNHSCDPNIFFDTERRQVVTIKQIDPGDELRFFYPSTEWEIAEPFICNCGSKDCLQLINGAAHLSSATLNRYRLTSFIQEQVSKKYS